MMRRDWLSTGPSDCDCDQGCRACFPTCGCADCCTYCWYDCCASGEDILEDCGAGAFLWAALRDDEFLPTSCGLVPQSQFDWLINVWAPIAAKVDKSRRAGAVQP